MDSQAVAIAKWAEGQSKSHRKPTKRLTAEEIGLLLKLHKDGLTQVAIAQRLDCDQAAVSRWLNKLTDSTETAKSYLRGSALQMAQNIVRRGRAADHVAALKGLSVLHDETHAGVTVVVGGGSDVKIGLVQPLQVVVEALPDKATAETLTNDAVSDKADYVNRVSPEDSTG